MDGILIPAAVDFPAPKSDRVFVGAGVAGVPALNETVLLPRSTAYIVSTINRQE